MAGELWGWLVSETRTTYRAPPELANALQLMLSELMSQRLEVGLAPSEKPDVAQRGGKVRQVLSHNPDWYRKYAGQFTARRSVPRAKQSHDTLIKRRDIIHTLQGLLQPTGTVSSYAPSLIEAAKAYQAKLDAEDAAYREQVQRSTTTKPVVQQATADELDDFMPF